MVTFLTRWLSSNSDKSDVSNVMSSDCKVLSCVPEQADGIVTLIYTDMEQVELKKIVENLKFFEIK